MTGFMLIMCMIALTTMSLTNMKLQDDLVDSRVASSALSTDGEIVSTNGVILKGTDVISALVGINAIDNEMSYKQDKIYRYMESNGTYQSRYVLKFGSYTTAGDIIKAIQPNEIYTLTYEFDNTNNTARVTIVKGGLT